MNDDELMHYGKMGMKWGKKGSSSKSSAAVKKGVSNAISRITSKNKKGPNSTDHANVASIKGKKMSTLSNAQLRMFNERVQLEKTYKTLKADRGATRAGSKFVKDMLLGSAKQAAGAYVTKNMSSALASVLSKATTA